MTDQWSSGRRKELYLKANNKFLLISFDKLESDSSFSRIQAQGFEGRSENQ